MSTNNSIRPWPTVASNQLGDFNIFKVRHDRRQSPRTGEEHDFHILEMPEWINIIPLTDEGKVVIIRQYRHGTDQVSASGNARRNRLRCCGDRSHRSRRPESGTAEQPLSHLRAFGAHKVDNITLDASEDIAVEEIEVNEIERIIADGELNHGIIIAGFYWFDLYRKLKPSDR